MKIFGQHVIRHYGACHDLRTMQRSSDPSQQAIAENLGIDDRVPKPRRKGFLKFMRNKCLKSRTDKLYDHLKNHKDEFATRHFAAPEVNNKNLVYCPNHLDCPKIPPDTELVSVRTFFPALEMKLIERIERETGFIELARDAFGSLNPFEYFLKNAHDENDVIRPEASEWISQSFNEVNSDGSGGYKQRILWAGRFDEFQMELEKGPECWCEVFGLGHFLVPANPDVKSDSADEWFALLKYRVETAGLVARPTVLEAGATEWHYPTPGNWHVGHGGKTMILGEMRHRIAPKTEFVHPVCKILASDVVAVRQLRNLPTAPLNVSLLRSEHCTRLKDFRA